ncbi:hypothetical protein J0910_17635 [Nocardiopsis sp. CNT-189]|uniref:hypothetical protein n=1 Tax=Nocardiopsis oceanisediminis TaxID=2816862 RepID=UPI003B29C6B5
MTETPVHTRTRFFDHRIPSLSGGKYDITVTQGIDEIPESRPDLPDVPQPFDVRTQRFVIGEDDVRACYPVPDTLGDYKGLLPHITVNAPALPWARTLPDRERETPWTALLVFREDELPEDRDALGEVAMCTVRELLDGDAGGTPPAIDPDTVFDDEWDLACATVLIPGPLLAAVLPRAADAELLAHTREGGPPDATHTRSGYEDDPPREEELTSVVVANRFPAPEGRHVAHLISLEGLEGYLDGSAPDGDVRAVSLWSWSFEAEDRTTIGFGDVVGNLATEGLPEGDQPDLLLRLRTGGRDGSSGAGAEARARLDSGAAPLPHRLDSGELSYAFYRGPIGAAPARKLPDELPPRFDSAGSALVYLEDYGVFDATYAAAFTLGRTLALADAEFRRHLLAYRAAARSAARRLAADQRLSGLSTAQTAELLRPGAARRAFDRLLTASGGESFAAAVDGAGPELRTGARRIRTRARGMAAPPRLRTADVRAGLARAEVRGAIRTVAETELEPVKAWLDRLRLLEPVPFGHLVPSYRDGDGEGMLPPETVRFGFIDPGWVRAAVDGALSVGVGHVLDAALNELAAEDAAVPASAVLVRSELVPNWPDTVYTGELGGEAVEPVRTAHVGEDIAVFLFDEVIDAFHIAEPPQGLHFGISSRGQLTLRNLDPDQGEVGEQVDLFPEETHAFGRFLRNPSDAEHGADVLAVAEGDDPVAAAVAAELGRDALTPAEFALQMINAPELQRFLRPQN